jgi:flagellar protein FlgJ
VRRCWPAARSTDFGGDDLFGGQGEETFREMRDSEFARLAARAARSVLAARIEGAARAALGNGG